MLLTTLRGGVVPAKTWRGGHGRPAGAPVGEGQRSAANNFADDGAGPDWLC
jgi:hypothetical protein